MSHIEIDQVSLELARQVAERLRRQPELLELASANLSRWKQLNAGAPSLLRCYLEWEQILTRPIADICELLCSQTDEGQRLRQNSPFAGALTAAEVWAIKARLRHAETTA